MDWSLWSTFSSFVFIHSPHKWLPTTQLSYEWEHDSALSISSLFQDSDFADDLEDSKLSSCGNLCIFRIQTFVTMSWMCWLGWEKSTHGCFQRATPHRTHTTDHTTDTTCTPTHNTLHHTQDHTETEKREEDKRRRQRRGEKKKRTEKRCFRWKMSQTSKIPKTNKLIMFRKKKKKTFGRIKSSESTHVFNYLHDSNSNFRPAGIYSEWARDRIVWLFPGESRLFGCCEQVCTCRWVLLGATRCGAEKKEMKMLVRQVPKQIVGESGGEARVNVDFREEEQEECVSLSQCKNCEQVEDEKVMLREERETGIKKKWAKEEGPTNSKHISKGMVLLNKHHSNAAASNWAWKRQIGWQETSQSLQFIQHEARQQNGSAQGGLEAVIERSGFRGRSVIIGEEKHQEL